MTESYRLETKDVLDLINEIETVLPVHEWETNGFHIWPLLRIQISFQLDSLVAKPMNARSFQHIHAALAKAFKIPNGLSRYYAAKIFDNTHNETLDGKTDCFFYSYSSARRFRVKDAWYDVYTDPLIEKLAERNLFSKVLEYADDAQFRTPRFRSSRLENPLILHIMQGRTFSDPYFSLSDELRKYLMSYKQFLSQRKLERFFPDEGSIRFRVLMIRFYAEYFKKIFRNMTPRFAFGSNYYGFREMGLNLACKETGVISVDIQHGVQGNMHVAYGRWTGVPQGGYEVMPNVFWNWSDEEKEVIDKWAINTQGRHRSIVGGNPLLEIFSEPAGKLSSEFDHDVRVAFGSVPSGISKHILVTLQPDVGISRLLNEILAHSSKEYFWWIRLHPNMVSQKSRTKDKLREYASLNWNVDGATSLPLYALLKQMDVHMTASSSTVIEAEYFGVPSILIHPQAQVLYPAQIEKGTAHYASSSEEALKLVATLAGLSTQTSIPSVSKMTRGLEELLRSAS